VGLLDGKVALVTGAARGQGRSHAVHLAREGADVIAVDLCAQPDALANPAATRGDLAETERRVDALGRRVVAGVADVRDLDELTRVVQSGVERLGGLDVVCANAGVWAVDASTDEVKPGERAAIWNLTLDTNLTGVFNTLEAAVPAMIDGSGGSIVITSSTAAFRGMSSIDEFGSRLQVAQIAYDTSKHALTGLMRSAAHGLAKHNIRVNCVAPAGVATPMVQNEIVGTVWERYPDYAALMGNLLPVDILEPEDVSNAILYLVSDAARYVTGITLPVDAGFLLT